MTSVGISARFPTGPGQVGVVEIPDAQVIVPAYVTPVTDSGHLVTLVDP